MTKAKASFKWDDPLLLDLQLSEEERMVRDTAQQYCQDKLLPRVTQAYIEEKTDREIFNEMGELGLIGVTLPEEYGCANALAQPYSSGSVTPIRPSSPISLKISRSVFSSI